MKNSEKIEYDEISKEWFARHPDAVVTCTCCEVCGLAYNTGLKHKCKGYYDGANQVLLSQLGITPKKQRGTTHA